MGKTGRVLKRGFTLIEVMISTSLMGLVTLGFASVYSQVHASYVRTANSVIAQNELSYTLESIRKRVQIATQITSVATEQLSSGDVADDNYYGVRFTIDPDGPGPLPVSHGYLMAGNYDPDGPAPAGPLPKKPTIRYYEDQDLGSGENLRQFAGPNGPVPFEVVCTDLFNEARPGFFPGTQGPSDPPIFQGSGAGNSIRINKIVIQKGKGKTAARISIRNIRIFSRGTT